jgi:hypothetical protein
MDEEDDNEPFEPDSSIDEEDDIPENMYDQLLTAEVLLPQGDQMKMGHVTGYKRDQNGNPIGRSHVNPLLNSRMYQVEFTDGTRQDYAANMIAEAIYSQVDDEGNKLLLFNDVIAHRKNKKAVKKQDMYIRSTNGNKHMKKTTIGWEFCMSWKDGSTSWETLANLKSSYPIQIADYAIANNTADEPAFAWWIPPHLHHKERILKALKGRAMKRNQKFGITIPQTVEEALRIDKETNTTYWSDAIAKEMKNNRIAFEFLNENERVSHGYKYIRCHMNFEVKMDFTRKARFIAGGHMTDPPPFLTYSTVVSRDSVRIGFLLAALNNLDLVSIDIGNAYLQAKNKERVYTIAGPEFGELQGQKIIIVRALYGLKSSRAAWHDHFAANLHDMNFQPSYADPDVWMQAATKPDGSKYYEYILVYVDDLLIISHQTTMIVNAIKKLYRLKDDVIGPPKTYLGAQVKQISLPYDTSKTQWAVSAEQYIKNAVMTIEKKLNIDGMKLNSQKYASTPLSNGYRPELDYTPLLSDEAANFYQQLIGILRWITELGRIDILVHVTLLSSYLMQPHEGHLKEALRILAYLKHHSNAWMTFDEIRVDWNEEEFPNRDWTKFYHNATDELPHKMPEPRGNEVQINCFVDADHAGKRITSRSHTGIFIFVNRAPIMWYSKAQNTVESSTFGAEFVATKITVELVESLRYKLRMFGVPLEGAANMFVDNQSVVINATVPSSTLKKKHNSIAYHLVREAIAAKIIKVAKVHGKKNLADMFTKPLPVTLLYILL